MSHPDEEIEPEADDEDDGREQENGEGDRFAIFRGLEFATDFILPEDGLRDLEERLRARDRGREED